MVQKLMFALTLILATTWLMAQEPASQGSSSQAGTAASSGSGQTAVEGCLQGSNGSFTLTDKAGTTYQLQGDTSKLAEHVGHEVQITGTTSSAVGLPGLSILILRSLGKSSVLISSSSQAKSAAAIRPYRRPNRRVARVDRWRNRRPGDGAPRTGHSGSGPPTFAPRFLPRAEGAGTQDDAPRTVPDRRS